MKTLADLEAEHTAARAKLEAEHATAALAPAVPDYVGIHRKRPHWIVYRKRSLTQALELAALFADVAPIYRHKGTFTELTPEGFADPKAEVTAGPFACFLDVDSGARYGPSAKLSFFAFLPDPAAADGRQLVKVGIDIDGPDYIGGFSALAPSRQPVKWGRRGEVTEWRIGPNAALAGLADSYVQWAGGSKDDSRISYLFCADTEAAGPWQDNAHAIGQLQNLRDEFQPAPELIESTARADYYRFPGAKGGRDTFQAVKPGAPAPANAAGYYDLESLKSLKGDS